MPSSNFVCQPRENGRQHESKERLQDICRLSRFKALIPQRVGLGASTSTWTGLARDRTRAYNGSKNQDKMHGER